MTYEIVRHFSLLVLLTFILTAFRFDAAVDEYLIAASEIHPAVLAETKGVITVTFSDLDYNAHFKMKPGKLLRYDYTDTTSYRPSHHFVTIDNSKGISGIHYNNMITRRFPIVSFDAPMVQIVYDVQKNLRTWVVLTDGKYVRTSVGQLMPVAVSRPDPATNLDHSYDVFYF